MDDACPRLFGSDGTPGLACEVKGGAFPDDKLVTHP